MQEITAMISAGMCCAVQFMDAEREWCRNFDTINIATYPMYIYTHQKLLTTLDGDISDAEIAVKLEMQ